MKVLVLGCTGMLGHRVVLELLRDGSHEVSGTTHSRMALANTFFTHAAGKTIPIRAVDLMDPKETDFILGLYDPDVVINCAGVLKHHLGKDSGSYREALRLNADLPHQLAEWVESKSKYLITFSSDCVFQGDRAGPYYPSALCDARDLYGRTKALGEIRASVNVYTVRTSFIGYELDGQTSLLEWFLDAADKQPAVNGYYCAGWSGVSTAFLAGWVVRSIAGAARCCGHIVVAGQPTNKYELLCNIKDALGLDVKINKDTTFRSGSVCNRTMLSTFPTPPSWDVDGELIGDIIGEHLMYQEWRQKCQPV